MFCDECDIPPNTRYIYLTLSCFVNSAVATPSIEAVVYSPLVFGHFTKFRSTNRVHET